jgi:hypothetical protein
VKAFTVVKVPLVGRASKVGNTERLHEHAELSIEAILGRIVSKICTLT